ncbi:hypothetical protein EMIT0158MI4_100136 [Burkholderia ambifaria]
MMVFNFMADESEEAGTCIIDWQSGIS